MSGILAVSIIGIVLMAAFLGMGAFIAGVTIEHLKQKAIKRKRDLQRETQAINTSEVRDE